MKMKITKSEQVAIQAILVTIIYLIPNALCNDSVPVPAVKSQVEQWFKQNVGPASSRKGTLDPALVAAEAAPRIIRMKSDGSGEFKTLDAAIKSIPAGNTKRVIIHLAGGSYKEKVKINRGQNFVTLVGDANNPPKLEFAGTAAQYGTFYSATLTVEAEYFSAVNVHFVNSAPKPGSGVAGKQAVALRIGGDKASFYSCRFIGFQDTLCDDQGRHFYKDCYIEGTVDFIFGAGRSMYLNTVVHIIEPGAGFTYATAQGAESKISNSGYSFVHCTVTGGGNGNGFLGRAWRPNPQVVFSFSVLTDIVNGKAWSNNDNAALDKSVFYAEFKNTGPKAALDGRYQYLRKFSDQEAKPYISLEYILGSKWLLPPASA